MNPVKRDAEGYPLDAAGVRLPGQSPLLPHDQIALTDDQAKFGGQGKDIPPTVETESPVASAAEKADPRGFYAHGSNPRACVDQVLACLADESQAVNDAMLTAAITTVNKGLARHWGLVAVSMSKGTHARKV